MEEKWWQKWWVWAISVISFLLIVHVLFNAHPKTKWLEAVWTPGDLLTFVGTVVLGYIAVYQTKRANDMTEKANQIAEQATQTSSRLMDLQEAEYIPIISISRFVGLSNANKGSVYVKEFLSKPHSDLIVYEMRTIKNEAIVGLSTALIKPNTTLDAEVYQRLYELHLKYKGKPIIKQIRICSVSFLGIDYEKTFSIETSPDLSLNDGDEYPFFLVLIGNESFTTETNESYKYICAPMMQIVVEMDTMQGKTFIENIVIHKHLVKQPEAMLNTANVEFEVSILYDVNEKS